MSASSKTRVEAPVLRVGPGRLSFPWLTEKHGINGGVEKFSTVLLLPPGYEKLQELMDALTSVCEQKWGTDHRKWPSNLRGPEQVVRPAEDKEHLAGYEKGWHFVSCSSIQQPNVIMADKSPLTSPSEVYGGRWANVTMRPFTYNNVGVGVSLGLNNVQLLRNDEKFGRTSAQQDFDVVAEELDEGF